MQITSAVSKLIPEVEPRCVIDMKYPANMTALDLNIPAIHGIPTLLTAIIEFRDS